MDIISVRERPEFKDLIISYFQRSWPKANPIIYSDCISHALISTQPLPQWYILMKGEEIIGCAGLITNDFISRMDLYPWICALFIEEKHRGNNYGAFLIEKANQDARAAGFKTTYLCTDHIGYYEKLGFTYLAQGYHPWGEESRIYQFAL